MLKRISQSQKALWVSNHSRLFFMVTPGICDSTLFEWVKSDSHLKALFPSGYRKAQYFWMYFGHCSQSSNECSSSRLQNPIFACNLQQNCSQSGCSVVIILLFDIIYSRFNFVVLPHLRQCNTAPAVM